MKQSELKTNVDKLYLEGLSQAIKREKNLKSNYQLAYEEGVMGELLEKAVDLLKSSKSIKGLINMLNQPGVLKNYQTTLAQNAGQIGRDTIEEIVNQVVSNFNRLNEGVIQKLDAKLQKVLSGGLTRSADSFAAESVKLQRYKRLMISEADLGIDDTLSGEADNVDFEDEEGTDETELDPEETDALDEADEILSQIDLTSISNGVRLELIEAIIDSAQNAVDGEEANDDDFSDFMQQISDVIDSFRYDGEEAIEGEEEMELPEEGEEMAELPAEAGTDERPLES